MTKTSKPILDEIQRDAFDAHNNRVWSAMHLIGTGGIAGAAVAYVTDMMEKGRLSNIAGNTVSFLWGTHISQDRMLSALSAVLPTSMERVFVGYSTGTVVGFCCALPVIFSAKRTLKAAENLMQNQGSHSSPHL